MKNRVILPVWLNIYVIIGSIALGILFLCTVTGVFMLTSNKNTAAQSTAILEVIYAATATQASSSVTPQTEQSEASQIPPSPPPGTITVGSHVQVTGTGGEGLRLRIEPSLDGQILMLGSEAEVFRVHEGPREADGYTWWYLVGPFDSSRYGWAVANFLVVVQGP
ncbi:MAG: hypothetical protein A2Z16_13965 [Chloroflexi bacterium RBG_16_54_18]|nr:MAG: hypothetical protein A2Z16_13965 [Chloroflexi bacterium RBG_16_54_18]